MPPPSQADKGAPCPPGKRFSFLRSSLHLVFELSETEGAADGYRRQFVRFRQVFLIENLT